MYKVIFLLQRTSTLQFASICAKALDANAIEPFSWFGRSGANVAPVRLQTHAGLLRGFGQKLGASCHGGAVSWTPIS